MAPDNYLSLSCFLFQIYTKYTSSIIYAFSPNEFALYLT